MSSNPRFPSWTEIKRVISAASRAGVAIGMIEIYPDKITIRAKDPSDVRRLSEYDLWKISDQEDTDRAKHVGEKSDALPFRPKS